VVCQKVRTCVALSAGKRSQIALHRVATFYECRSNERGVPRSEAWRAVNAVVIRSHQTKMDIRADESAIRQPGAKVPVCHVRTCAG